MDSKRNLSTSAALASSVAVLLLSGCGMEDDNQEGLDGQEAQLTCVGGNECAGMSECAGGPGGNSCEGMNECAGMGWVYVSSEDECEEKGGEIKAES